ncbi:hypothetical protein LJC47_07010, partial [Desulfosarcina sp. OttesenSCG-928-B08]|nr:hypothetical protein [Desulfosarcina sp. OttesenSCG-928-B08]
FRVLVVSADTGHTSLMVKTFGDQQMKFSITERRVEFFVFIYHFCLIDTANPKKLLTWHFFYGKRNVAFNPYLKLIVRDRLIEIFLTSVIIFIRLPCSWIHKT